MEEISITIPDAGFMYSFVQLCLTNHWSSQLLVRLLVQIANAVYVSTVDEHCSNISPTILSLYFVYVTSYLNVTMHCGLEYITKLSAF